MTFHWTLENVEKLKTLWDEGLSCSLISEQIPGTTRNAVISKVRRINLPFRAVPKVKAKQRPPAERNVGDKVVTIRRKYAFPTPTTSAELSLGVSLADIERMQCHFITSNDGEETAYCGHAVYGVSSWCPGHYRVVFQRRAA